MNLYSTCLQYVTFKAKLRMEQRKEDFSNFEIKRKMISLLTLIQNFLNLYIYLLQFLHFKKNSQADIQ